MSWTWPFQPIKIFMKRKAKKPCSVKTWEWRNYFRHETNQPRNRIILCSDLLETKSTGFLSTNFRENFFAKLSFEESMSFESDLILGEIKNILKSFQNNKSPGRDGFSKELWNILWPTLRDRGSLLETRRTSARNRTILWSRRRPRPGTNKLKKNPSFWQV